MTPEQIAEVRPRLVDFAAEMLGDLPRKDQRAAGELYARGLLTDGRRKSMQPMAARLGMDHQRLQQFITSSTWDYVPVRRNVAQWFAASQPVEALVVDDTGFPKDGSASPCVARQYSGTLGKIGNCQVAVSVHLVNEQASCAADWWLFCPESWDDQALDDPAAAARAARQRERAGLPDEIRHTEKWRLALQMIEEMTGPDGWALAGQITAAGGARPVVVSDAGYGDNALFREELTTAGWRYVVAVKGTASAYPGQAVPQPRPYGGRGQPPKPAYPHPPAAARCSRMPHPPGPAISSIISSASRHFSVWRTSPGIPACRRRRAAPAAATGSSSAASSQLSGQNSRQSAAHEARSFTRWTLTPTWQLPILPSVPEY